MTINDNTKKTLRRKSCHLSQSASDIGALVMMCERDEEPWPIAVVCWRIVMTFACYKVMVTRYL